MAKYLSCDGITIPTVGLGTWELKNETDIETALGAALETGYRHIDTAFIYENERAVGRVLNKWIKSGKLKRKDLFVTTKLATKGLHRDRVEKYMKFSLANLGLDYVDLYLIHFPVGIICRDGEIEFETHDHKEVWKSMEEQVIAGRTKAIGLSNFSTKQIDNILTTARIKPVCNQIELHVYMQQPELVEFCQAQDILIVAYSPLGSPGYNKFVKRLGTVERLDLLNALKDPIITKIGVKYNKTNSQIVLRFLVQQNIVVIPKSANPNRIQENFDLFSFDLDDNDMQKLKSLNIGEEARVWDFKCFPKIDKHPDYPFGSNKY